MRYSNDSRIEEAAILVDTALIEFYNQGDKKTLGQGKVVIIIDKSNGMFETTGLDEYVNIASNSIFMRALNNLGLTQ